MSPRTAAKDQRDAYERRGVEDYWLVHPTDQTLIVDRLVDCAYVRPDVQALIDETAVATIAGFFIFVEFEPAHTPGLLGIAGMEIELSEMLGGKQVDLRTAGDLSHYFRDDVVRMAEVQYAR